MRINTFIPILILAIILGSCSLNNTFLKPTIVPKGATSNTLYIQGDTVNIQYIGDEYQPLFIRNGDDTVSFNYTIESVMFESTSGNNLNGWMLTPREIEPKGTILFFHGNAGYITSQHWSVTLLLQYGFQAFVIDYSGYGFSEGKPTRKNVLKDGNSALQYLKTRADVEDTKVIIYGQSLGGHLAPVVAAANEDKIDGLIIEGAFSSHKDIGKEFAGILGTIFVKEQYSAVEAIANFHKPVLIIHSTEDDVIPYTMGEKLYEHANQPKELYTIDGCHICGSRLYHEKIGKKMRKMIGIDE